MRRLLRNLVLVLAGLACAGHAAPTQLTLNQARQMAQVALAHGDAALAWRLAEGLLAADPDDAGAHFIMAQAASVAGAHAQARKSAARAYRSTDAPRARLQAAQLAARAAWDEERPTLTQLWLRRAATNASTDGDVTRIAQDYGAVRRVNPLSFRLAGSLRPSSNVNNGADTALQTVDGIPTEGSLNGAAQALSGTVGTLDLSLSYRIAASQNSQTRLGTRLYTRQVRLSGEAQALAPTARNADFASTYADISLWHDFALGADGNTAGVGLTAGRAWSGGSASYDFGKLSARRSIRLSEATRLGFHTSVEARRDADLASQDQTIAIFGASLSHVLPGGDRIRVSVSHTDVDADHPNTARTAQSLRLGYSFAKAWGPAEVSAALTLGQAEYSGFLVGPFRVPGGRQDNSLYADVTLFFADYSYAGFAPALKLRTGRRNSNVSKFDSTEMTIGFEIQSKF